jgi:hypothetical protein
VLTPGVALDVTSPLFVSLHRQTFFRLVKGEIFADIAPPDVHGPHEAADYVRSS